MCFLQVYFLGLDSYLFPYLRAGLYTAGNQVTGIRSLGPIAEVLILVGDKIFLILMVYG